MSQFKKSLDLVICACGWREIPAVIDPLMSECVCEACGSSGEESEKCLGPYPAVL